MIRKINFSGSTLSKQSAGGLLRGCFAFILAIFCSGCEKQFSTYEVAHLVSPNGSFEAVLTETNGGATTSFGYEVSIAPKGAGKAESVASLYGAVRNEQAYGVNLSWVDNHTLRVQYLRAKAVQNVAKTVIVQGQQIAIQMQSGIEDSRAPRGGMHYNLIEQSH